MAAEPTLPTPPGSPREALSLAPWLSAVAPATLDALAEAAVVFSIPAGVTVFEQADTPTFVHFLLSGTVDLLAVRDGVETLIERVRPIDTLLPAAALNRRPYLARARVEADAVFLMVQVEAFREAVERDHAFCLAMLACQAAQFRQLMKQAKALRLRSAEERAGRYLVTLAEESRAGAVRLPLEKRLIASQLGMTRETFSRALSAMPRFGLRVEGDRLHVEDLAAARSAFPFDPLLDGREAIVPLTVRRNPR